jgi:hypothetical protein
MTIASRTPDAFATVVLHHGTRREAVTTLLSDDEWTKWSDHEIARRCGVGHAFVSAARASLSIVDSEKPLVRTYTTKHGTESTMQVRTGAER